MKKIRYAWKRFLLWIGAAALLLTTLACVKPTEPAAPSMQLDMVQMLETAASKEENKEDMCLLASRLLHPSSVHETITAADGKLVIELDADVEIPEAATVSIIRVRKGKHTQEDVEKLTEGLRGSILFDPNYPQSFLFDSANSSWNRYSNTCHQRVITNQADFSEAEWSKLKLIPEEAREMVEDYLKQNELPMTIQYVTVLDWLFEDPLNDPPDMLYPDVLAETIYIIGCSRTIQGVSCSLAPGETGGSLEDGGIPYEKFSIAVDKDGINYMSWAHPIEILDTVVEDAALIPFDEIMNVFRAVAPLRYVEGASNESYSRGASITVKRIALQYQMVSGSGLGNGTALLVPAWCFYGDVYLDEIMSNTSVLADWQIGTPQTIAVINAVDGSVISPTLGY